MFRSPESSPFRSLVSVISVLTLLAVACNQTTPHTEETPTQTAPASLETPTFPVPTSTLKAPATQVARDIETINIIGDSVTSDNYCGPHLLTLLAAHFPDAHINNSSRGGYTAYMFSEALNGLDTPSIDPLYLEPADLTIISLGANTQKDNKEVSPAILSTQQIIKELSLTNPLGIYMLISTAFDQDPGSAGDTDGYESQLVSLALNLSLNGSQTYVAQGIEHALSRNEILPDNIHPTSAGCQKFISALDQQLATTLQR